MKPDYRQDAPTSKPDIIRLREEFQWAVEKRDSNYFRRQRINYETRNCLWRYQSNDGRKWNSPKGQKIFPWPGASDQRVPMVDMFINEDVAKLMVVDSRNRIVVAGTESNDTDFGNRLTQVLRWMRYTQMRERRREVRLLANYFFERGAAVAGMFWEKCKQLGYDQVDLEMLTGLAMEAQSVLEEGGGSAAFLPPSVDPERLIALPQMILDRTKDADSGEILAALYPDVDKMKFRTVVADLRKQGFARFPRPYVVKNRPCMVALALNEDLFIAPECIDIRKGPTWDRLELVTETDLRERISYGWDEGWIDEVIATQRGSIPTDYNGQMLITSQYRVNSRGLMNTDKLYAVVHGYRRQHDVNGVPGIYYTCYHPNITDSYAQHTLLNYDHGEAPFTLFERETRSRLIDDSRGYGEILNTLQQHVKVEIDSRIDRSSIATLPPTFHPPGEEPDRWGPGVQIGTTRKDDYGYFETPRHDRGSEEIEQRSWRLASRYVGRVVDEENVMEASILNQDMANNWMGAMAEVDAQMLKLMQQFMPEEFYYRVVGSNKARSIRASREEIQGSFDVSISYNIGYLDPEKTAATMELIEKALTIDAGGRVDRDALLEFMFELFDPNLGERVLRPAGDAAMMEIEDEDLVLSKMATAIGTDVKPGQAWRLRRDRLMQRMQSTPKLQKLYQEDEDFKELVDNRMQQLTQQIVQTEVNPTVGVLGDQSVSTNLQGGQ